jgi:chorismate synthase
MVSDDARPVLERASARETAARVALGEVARQYLSQAYRIEVLSHVVAIGSVQVPEDTLPEPADRARIDEDPGALPGSAASAAMVAQIDAARKDGDTLGGVVEVVAYGLPPGLGSHVHWDRRLDGAGRGPDEHPGHQGCRGGGRVHHRPAPRVAGPRRDRAG